jgi:DedD protein
MDRRVKERLVGASILVALIVLIVPELLSGPAPSTVMPKPPLSAPEPVRNVTVDLAPGRVMAPAAEAAIASSARPPQSLSGKAAGGDTASGDTASGDTANRGTASGGTASGDTAGGAAAGASAAPSVRLETAAPPPKSAAAAAKPAMAGHAWAVQLGSFASRDNADKLLRQLRAQGFSVYLSSGGSGPSPRYRVRIGPMGHAASIVPPAP